MLSINKICPLSLIILDSCIVTIIVYINTNYNRSCWFLLITFFREHNGAISRAGTGIPFRCTWIYSRFLVGFMLLNLCVDCDTTGAISRAGTATLSEPMWSLCCLSVFDLWLLVTSLVSSIFYFLANCFRFTNKCLSYLYTTYIDSPGILIITGAKGTEK
jgi:hypothetical protein